MGSTSYQFPANSKLLPYEVIRVYSCDFTGLQRCDYKVSLLFIYLQFEFLNMQGAVTRALYDQMAKIICMTKESVMILTIKVYNYLSIKQIQSACVTTQA